MDVNHDCNMLAHLGRTMSMRSTFLATALHIEALNRTKQAKHGANAMMVSMLVEPSTVWQTSYTP